MECTVVVVQSMIGHPGFLYGKTIVSNLCVIKDAGESWKRGQTIEWLPGYIKVWMKFPEYTASGRKF